MPEDTNTQPLDPVMPSVLDENAIRQILYENHHVEVAELKKAEEYSKTHHVPILDYLYDQNLITKDMLGQIIAQSFGIAFADLEKWPPSREHISLIPSELGERYRAVVFGIDDTKVMVATDQPQHPELMNALQHVFAGKEVQIMYGLSDDLDSLMVYYRKPLATRFSAIIQQQKRVAPEILDEIIQDALAFHVSDIHIEPEEEVVVIRFRIDGVLHEAGELPRQYYDNVLNRIKVMSHMRIDQHNSSQDGAIRYEIMGEPVDIRISIVPILDGEKVVMRLLTDNSGELIYKNLGFSNEDQKLIAAQAKRPFGMIITTGPTGSGKTTTLYALLKMIYSPEINITTIEDPVEYKIIGANQIQVNSQTNLTFAQGLRSIVRQDPNVILVGEIRDDETANLAVNAALTGHLLFSTFHANDAATAIPRLINLGVEPFLLASTLNVIIAQRLARRIHENCRVSFDTTLDQLKHTFPQAGDYFRSDTITLYRGKGCEGCNHTGYKGRVGIFEIITVTPAIKELILKRPSSAEIWKLADKEGAHSLFEDGIAKVQAGMTSLQELMRVAEPKQ